jgi:hypothetical protein
MYLRTLSLYPLKLALTLRRQAAVAQSVGIVRLRTQAMEFSFFLVSTLCWSVYQYHEAKQISEVYMPSCFIKSSHLFLDPTTCLLLQSLPTKILYAYFLKSLTHGAEPFLRSRQLCSHWRTSQRFMEPEGSSPYSQEPSTGPWARSIQFMPSNHISLRSI